MLKSKKPVFPLVALAGALVLALVFAFGCGESVSSTTTVSSASSGAGETGGSETLLEVTGPDGTKAYSLDEIRAIQSTEGYGGMKSSTGRITLPTLVRGVLLKDLFAPVGGLPADMAVSIIAKDGYEMTISFTQLDAGDFLTYDMVTGAENKPEGPLKVIIAYENDGKPLNPEVDGTLRMAIVGPKKEQVTDGHWWVKWVTKLQVKAIEQDWSVTLSGALNEEIDRATFESCSAQGCHGQVWADADGIEWTGVPLYLLVGRVDDENPHSGPAYDRELANAGYEVEISGADGKTVTVPSKAMYYNKELIVAYEMNGQALTGDFWPLRLVGVGVDSAGMVGQIAQIKALLPAQ
jgi:hypothetical protein